MARDWMHYDRLVQSAMKGVVRQILRRIQAQGLPGDHHVYIVFRTTHPGVVIPGFLKERYPEEMTIVLQHQFWGLDVFDDRFRVGLSFNKSPQELTVPFASVKGFFDPSVQFGLQFDLEDVDAPLEDNGAAALARKNTGKLPSLPGADPVTNAPPDAKDEAKDAGKGEVVSLDAFRKK